MLKQTNINHRQTETVAVPATQEFDSPQTELAWLKENRRNLQGFVRVLEIIEDMQKAGTCLFSFDQSRGKLSALWLAEHRDDCAACAGALLHWFFGPAKPVDGYWDFLPGAAYLDNHLGFAAGDYRNNRRAVLRSPSARALAGVIRELSGDSFWRPRTEFSEGNCPYGGTPWPVSHLAVFRRLAELHPDK